MEQEVEIFNHSDLMRKGEWQRDLRTVAERADVVIIDEAHNFRNTGTKGSNPEERQSRYWRLFDLIQDKTVFMLTATPVNNQLTDLLHMIELFSRQKPDYFKGKDADKIAAFDRGRQEQVVRLIRTAFLKRFESSVEAFRMSCWRLLKKLLAWAEVHAIKAIPPEFFVAHWTLEDVLKLSLPGCESWAAPRHQHLTHRRHVWGEPLGCGLHHDYWSLGAQFHAVARRE